MSEKLVKPVPEEDLGRGGDAAVSFPAGSPGAREVIARGLGVPLGLRRRSETDPLAAGSEIHPRNIPRPRIREANGDFLAPPATLGATVSLVTLTLTAGVWAWDARAGASYDLYVYVPNSNGGCSSSDVRSAASLLGPVYHGVGNRKLLICIPDLPAHDDSVTVYFEVVYTGGFDCSQKHFLMVDGQGPCL